MPAKGGASLEKYWTIYSYCRSEAIKTDYLDIPIINIYHLSDKSRSWKKGKAFDIGVDVRSNEIDHVLNKITIQMCHFEEGG